MTKVLVVDDSLSVRKVVEKALGGRNVEVLSAATAGEAIERIDRDRPDLVVCDVILPDKDGYEVCEYVRAHPTLARIPVLLISGVVNSTVLARAAEVQSSDVMFKPFAADELVRKIDGLLHGRAANGPAVGRRASPAAGSDHAMPLRGPSGPRVADGRSPGLPATAGELRGERPAFVPWAERRPGERDDAAPAVAPVLEAAGDLKAQLEALAATPGVRMAALADLDGFQLESAGDAAAEADAVSAAAAALRTSSEDLGRDLGQGALQGMILEYEQGFLLLHRVGATALLSILLDDAAALGKVRYMVKKALPELERSL
ncbi:MAG TPA: response regulator [Calidithermus sp.]|nr:response regulator [Calidithermus sp.]